ncbi:MAG: class I SAM-dependent methyltransferase [Thermodesulfobacteriota bacterium]|nr:class I SAM-dependent methyltransferase [Thermodesulfobacteriota bacterium]
MKQNSQKHSRAEKTKETDSYKQQYQDDFVDKWDDLIDWEARAEGEGSFFINLLKGHGKKKVLDLATGTGYHSVNLMNAGFEVHSADGSMEMLHKASENGRKQGLLLRTIQADWRWLTRDIAERYDVVICLGNSFTHLFKEADRRKALAEFYAALKHDGILVIDQRNYDNMLDSGFTSKHKYYYAGNRVKAEPVHIADDLVIFEYAFPDESTYNLNMFPLRKNYFCNLIYGAGFQNITTYGDFRPDYVPKQTDFYIHVATKA